MLKHLFLSCALLLTPVQAGAAQEPAQALAAPFQLAAASGHRLSAAQIQKLRSSGVPLVVPGYVPAGYVVKDILIETSDLCGGSKSYTIFYMGAKNENFLITGNACGIGGGTESDMFMQIANKFFGAIGLERFGPNDQRNSNYISTFYYRNKIYYIGSFGAFREAGSLRVPGPEIIKIIQNLRPL